MLATLTHPTFWGKINIKGPDDCWLWLKGRTGSHKGAGQYGRTRLGGIADLAHRVAYKFSHGVIPSGAHVLHSCDTPLCCNPNHLQTGTVAENMQDKVDRGRATGWPKGVSRTPHQLKNEHKPKNKELVR